ncbi:bifunctional [glutamine synthetase] adenylyltransferase/[glutamine synthetase]-adenylyl-L-tyrosine phosphorylase [Yinghuangia sp. ASG 101]|uniref:bifunctional [glutamine synthetase] adenylyltransferase/[glutamine synthetase]-adenylyl-L-tyrosine phosphorylase n=1 Tax=Yinghuangia sp. ASG 101 TaxID=2896848 RepID=UPI001E4CDF20|nr:bifunctional [glutamine synthetase] adenylyltransferase/[glutamine synthetase]-adenylyl-L-tyrosine phosphorylase [Yinghuangia sp. ASG 101]UGQ09945.1 bifunctional [glutamine synthetase] adenylyltransferase/[glutamine synthetase]-adenylyl-L-tyrosine phosphorylase [Yinghuangia sp. ASG 101]
MATSEPVSPGVSTARLVRLGFTDVDAAVRRLADPALASVRDPAQLLEALAATADPDLALLGLVRLAETADDRSVLLSTLAAAKPLRDRLLGVLGVSAALGDHLARHPDDWRTLVTYDVHEAHPTPEYFRRTLGAALDDPTRKPLTGDDALDALRVAYRRCLLSIAARDVCGTADVAQVSAELADLAGATLDAALGLVARELPEDAGQCRLAVIGMGKCGGRELNYVSDVDVVFVADAPPGVDEARALAAATRIAAAMMRACSHTTREGTIWPVDANLRPEGRNGPLVRTLASHLAYYERWAKTWEFQALLKARPVAGDSTLGNRYTESIAPLVWTAAQRDNFVPDVQAMRRRVVDSIPHAEVERELKLGPGGLRDIEFAVQLLQLVHGRADASLRSGSTLEALSALSAEGYVGRADGASLDEAYRFLRLLEHRVQLHRLRRTHLLPTDTADLRRLGRSTGFRANPVGELEAAWRRTRHEVRRLHEKLFYRPLLDAVARLQPGEARLTAKAAEQRLEALGYADPAGALRHLEALASGVSRRAAIQRTLLPVMLGWFADSADPDAGLLAFRQVSDALGNTHWYLRLLRDSGAGAGGAAAENMARVLSSGRLAPDLLLRAPEAVALLGDPDGLRPRSLSALESEILAAVGRAPSAEVAVQIARSVRRRELFRIAAADVLGHLDVDQVGRALSDVTAATLTGALRAATDAYARQTGAAMGTRLAVIGMGRFGGHEQGYASDADVLFVHEPEEGVAEPVAAKQAHAVANELRRLLQLPAADPPLVVDADLRPEGRQGPLVRTLASYRAYYDRWSKLWESQALLRAAPVAGDADLGARFLDLIAPLRWPAAGLDDKDVREIRRMKARIEAERLPRGADPTTHTKLGRGGLADVEWAVQLLQMQHAHTVPALRTTGTREALAAAAAAGLLDEQDARELDEAWVEATRVRNAVMVVRGRPSDQFPFDVRELAGVARLLGYRATEAGPVGAGTVIEDYRRITRHARSVVERVFYGEGEETPAGSR